MANRNTDQLILCGPVVRKVTPGQVAIWLALQSPARCQLSVFDGLRQHKEIDEAVRVGKTEQDTVRIGEKLHLVTLNLTLPKDQLLKWGQLYAYNLSFTQGGITRDLKDLGLLARLSEGTDNATALSYFPNHLPSFVLPAEKIENLKIAHGSCRNNDVLFEDALAFVDDELRDKLADPDMRLQQLFLSGDQVYADSVTGPLLHELNAWGCTLLNEQETLPTDWVDPATQRNRWPADIQHFPAFIRHRLIDSEARFTTTSKSSHLISFGEFAAMYLSVWSPVLWGDISTYADFEQMFNVYQQTPENYGAIFRRHLTDERSHKEITITIDNQTKTRPADQLFADETLKAILDILFDENQISKADLRLLLTKAPGSASVRKNIVEKFGDEEKQFDVKFLLGYLQDWLGGRYPTEVAGEEQDKRNKDKLRIFHRTLHKVRRALANVSTYMIFDDHEVTDDWNLNPQWRDRVYTSRLGKTIIRNGMISYALFQDWGNRPEAYNQKQAAFFELDNSFKGAFDSGSFGDVLRNAFRQNGIETEKDDTTIEIKHPGEWKVKNIKSGELFLARLYSSGGREVIKVLANPHAYLLKRIPDLFAGTESTTSTAEEEIDFLLGLDEQHRLVKKGNRFQLPDNRSPLLKWHYTFEGAQHRVLVIDNRTRRSHLTNGAPGNLSFNGMDDLIPANPAPKEDEVLFVVAPLPVLGPSVLDELVAPLAYKAFDLIEAFKGGESAKLGMIGTNPDAIEAWAFDPVSQEELFKRLAPFRRIVFLSGDVHYGASQRMHYWEKGQEDPACFAQLTSSGLRNVMPDYIQMVGQHLAFAQKLVRKEVRAERLGWLKNDPEPLQYKVDESLVSFFLRRKLKTKPILIPSSGWPKGTTIKAEVPYDWAWRVYNIWDERADKDRPKETNLVPLSGDPPDRTIDALRKIASRHIAQSKKANYTRQILFQVNLGLVSFENDEKGGLQLSHALMTVPKAGNADKAPQKPSLYTRHLISLEARGEEKIAPAKDNKLV